MKFNNGKKAQQVRQQLGLRQDQFWARVGVTQSAGSRYETGSRRLPKPLQMLTTLAFGEQADRARVLKSLRAAA